MKVKRVVSLVILSKVVALESEVPKGLDPSPYLLFLFPLLIPSDTFFVFNAILRRRVVQTSCLRRFLASRFRLSSTLGSSFGFFFLLLIRFKRVSSIVC